MYEIPLSRMELKFILDTSMWDGEKILDTFIYDGEGSGTPLHRSFEESEIHTCSGNLRVESSNFGND